MVLEMVRVYNHYFTTGGKKSDGRKNNAVDKKAAGAGRRDR